MLMQEKPRGKTFISSQKTHSRKNKRQKRGIFPYYPAIGYKWNTNLFVQWNFKKEK